MEGGYIWSLCSTFHLPFELDSESPWSGLNDEPCRLLNASRAPDSTDEDIEPDSQPSSSVTVDNDLESDPSFQEARLSAAKANLARRAERKRRQEDLAC